ncbi:RraA family protein [Fulvivirgaceae bacterium BMA12]|uniref:Putative 4-hydroxy-4-methyl-2-oxoglutarate aldolase n=1 Tax=Agaribacillus aureus TaxID=3051825 RepID=A0ABT8L6J7_9BACT|nr:RraA family protein [Fulvivirgaceae bacterium BMA12]
MNNNLYIKNHLNQIPLILLLAFLITPSATAQTLSKEQMIFYTGHWEGERFADGRPKVPDDLLQRMRAVTHEEAWSVMKNEGYKHQYEEGWLVVQPDSILVGRAFTAQFMPGRPDVYEAILKKGRVKGQNAWPVDALSPGDIYVADQFGAHIDGPTIGDNLANAIFANSGNGIVYNGAIRDIEGIKALTGFIAFVRSYHPSHHNPAHNINTTLMGINVPINIGSVMVIPGDIILGKNGGISVIPAHLAEKVVTTSEVIRLRDMFGHLRLREKKYTAGQIDSRWTGEIEKDFSQWLEQNINELPVPRAQIQSILKERTW